MPRKNQYIGGIIGASPLGAPALWSPTQLTTIDLWVDASDSSTVTTSGSSVTSWADKGSSSKTATGNGGPTLVSSAQNNLDVISFDGSNDYFSLSASITADETLSAYIVFNADVGTSGNRYLIDESGNSSYGGAISMRTLDTDTTRCWTQDAFRAATAANNSITRGSWSLISCHDQGSGFTTTSRTFKPGSTLTTTTGATGTQSSRSAANPRIGHSALLGGYFAGDIAEIIVVPDVSSVAERDRIEGYLAHKWGIEDVLDSGHTYKSAAPTV
jgi:hypothetical protein